MYNNSREDKSTELTAVGLRHVGAAYKAEVARAAVRRACVTGGQVDVEVVAAHRLRAIHREVATGTVD